MAGRADRGTGSLTTTGGLLPSPSTDPAAVDPLVLERIAVGAWVPDDLVEMDGWLWRAGEAFTGRGNSALALAAPSDTDDGWLPRYHYRGGVLTALVAWAREHGATASFLQVDFANDPARRLYEQAEFGEHTHKYLAAPTGPVSP